MRRLRHGDARRGNKSKTYNIWQSMIQRCFYPNHVSYKYYGAKGITVCNRWREYTNFLFDMGYCPIGKEIDRINNKKGYEPYNCRWVDSKQQQRNRSNNIKISAFGKSLVAADWAKITGINKSTIWFRVRRLGWSHKRAVTEQPKERYKRNEVSI